MVCVISGGAVAAVRYERTRTHVASCELLVECRFDFIIIRTTVLVSHRTPWPNRQ